MTAAESRVATAYARTREHLAYLGLSTASEHLAGELERASTETAAPVEVLERLLAAEVEATSARRLSGRLRFAHYPLDKRLAQFEFDFQPSIDRAVIAELSTLRFVEEHRNALFLGPPGVGKSHCETDYPVHGWAGKPRLEPAAAGMTRKSHWPPGDQRA